MSCRGSLSFYYLHSLEESGLMCGGYGTEDSCLMWSPDTGSWEEMLTLDVGRYLHSSWTPGTSSSSSSSSSPDTGTGTYLMGGFTSNKTTTLVRPDGTQEPGFQLKYET